MSKNFRTFARQMRAERQLGKQKKYESRRGFRTIGWYNTRASER